MLGNVLAPRKESEVTTPNEELENLRRRARLVEAHIRWAVPRLHREQHDAKAHWTGCDHPVCRETQRVLNVELPATKAVKRCVGGA